VEGWRLTADVASGAHLLIIALMKMMNVDENHDF
jgi:hypothetical protein